ncbi:SDR family oxidoreductase [Sphingomonas sp. ASV193]|uniref:SDR family oxidoreductase n=1 Tax=Sphingomonas sp. ASV193 TaxID=3144405 RepID=UPI0032E8DF8F
MPTVLITGAARGLGLEFAKQYAAEGWDVIATARGDAPDLAATGAELFALDMDDFAAVAGFGSRIDRPLDLLIANAGQMGPTEASSAEAGERWAALLRINTVAPALLVQALMPRLAEVKGKAIAISSLMGSIDDASGGYIPYRSSKAALNMAWHVLAQENRVSGVAMAVLHPGWVATDMGGQSAPVQPRESIAGMRQVIDALSIADTGSFRDYTGKPLAW